MTVRYDEISEILKIIDESSCDEFILETSDIKLVIRRRNTANPASAVEAASLPSIFNTTPTSPALGSQAPASKTAGGGHSILAPMVGTFYRSPSPGTPPFVEINSKVKEGDPICIIEVMKLFT